MNFNGLKSKLHTVAKGANKYAPELYLICAGISFTTAAVEAWREGTKASKLLEQRKAELGLVEEGDKLPAKEVVKTTWKSALCVAIPMGVGVGCLFGAHNVNAKRTAALTAAAKISEEALHRYKEKVIETIGEKKAEEVNVNMAKDLVGNNPVSTSYIINTGHGSSLYYDSFMGTYFLSDRNYIDKCINMINERMMTEMYISVGELYSELGLPVPTAAGLLGWDINKTGIIKQTYHYTEANDGTPCGVLDFYNLPLATVTNRFC